MASTAGLRRLGPLAIDLDQRRVSCDGRPVALTPRAFDLLARLVAADGGVVTKETLLADVWPDAFVDESNLKVTVSMLRKALDDAAPGRRLIETVPRQGYRAIARDEPAPPDSPAAEASIDRAAAASPRRSWRAVAAAGAALAAIVLLAIGFAWPRGDEVRAVAVLPLVNDTGDASLAYLADGLTDRLIDALSESPRVRVIASASVSRYRDRAIDPRDAGRELGVGALLTGRLTRVDGGVRVAVELVDTRDRRHLWGHEYVRPLDNALAAQHLAADVARTLRATLAGEVPRPAERSATSSLPAFQQFVRGRAFLDRRTREGLVLADDAFRAAIRADPQYAAAHAGLADVYMNLSVRGYMSPRDGRRQYESEARRAVELDPSLPDGHALLGLSYASYLPYDFAAADRELARALELGPGSAIAHFYTALVRLRESRVDEALAEVLTARELDPLSAIVARQVSLAYHLKRDYPHALEALRQANEQGPPFSSSNEVLIYVQLGLFDEARAALAEAESSRADDPILIYSRAIVDAASGHRDRAMDGVRALERLGADDDRDAHWIAKIYAALGDEDDAMSWLDRGLDSGSLGAFYPEEEVWDPLRAGARFPRFLLRAGFTR